METEQIQLLVLYTQQSVAVLGLVYFHHIVMGLMLADQAVAQPIAVGQQAEQQLSLHNLEIVELMVLDTQVVMLPQIILPVGVVQVLLAELGSVLVIRSEIFQAQAALVNQSES